MVPHKDYPMELLLQHIRNRGWVVGVHNDYKLQGVFHTFWLFTKGNKCVKGEGHSDLEALRHVSCDIDRLEGA